MWKMLLGYALAFVSGAVGLVVGNKAGPPVGAAAATAVAAVGARLLHISPPPASRVPWPPLPGGPDSGEGP